MGFSIDSDNDNGKYCKIDATGDKKKKGERNAEKQ
jgi:hypothetical protein